MKKKTKRKYINLKPNLNKVVGSILFAPLAFGLSKIIHILIFCRHISCLAGTVIPISGIPECTHYRLFSCCISNPCISTLAQKLKMLWVIIIFAILIYIIWSLIQKKK